MEAEDRIKKQDFAGAKASLDRILELHAGNGFEIPDAFYFRHAEVLHWIGLQEEAIQSLTRYLTIAGQDGEHYREAMRLLNVAKAAKSDLIARMEFVRIPAREFLMGSASSEAFESD